MFLRFAVTREVEMCSWRQWRMVVVVGVVLACATFDM